jgi:hypothetical protein
VGTEVTSQDTGVGHQGGTHYGDALRQAAEHFAKVSTASTVVPAEEMIWEDSAQGTIKHMVNEAYEWTKGSFVYIPPYVVHQHFAGEKSRVRLISATSRLMRALGFDGLEQLEDAPR